MLHNLSLVSLPSSDRAGWMVRPAPSGFMWPRADFPVAFIPVEGHEQVPLRLRGQRVQGHEQVPLRLRGQRVEGHVQVPLRLRGQRVQGHEQVLNIGSGSFQEI